jgi:hypothetical protein
VPTTLHQTLLHEHHDLLLASQHPSSSPARWHLATQYAMPARMWRHGIHSFLELLRHRVPDPLDHMLAFVYLAYSMLTLEMESAPPPEETWIESLGDLARFSTAAEEADLRDREVWSRVSRMYYRMAVDQKLATRSIPPPLAVLIRPDGELLELERDLRRGNTSERRQRRPAWLSAQSKGRQHRHPS